MTDEAPPSAPPSSSPVGPPSVVADEPGGSNVDNVQLGAPTARAESAGSLPNGVALHPKALATRARTKPWVLYGIVLLIATAGLVYELVAGAVASYVLGDSVAQFSLVIGVYLSALGIGAYVSKFIDKRLARRFVEIELATALVGGVSAPLLLFSFAHGGSFHIVLWAVVVTTGTLVGLELPLLMRLLRDQVAFKDLVAKALLFDYLGALVASVMFALVLVPTIGLIRTSLLFGLLNAVVGLVSTFLLTPETEGELDGTRIRSVIVIAILLGLFSQSERLMRAAEIALYADPIHYATQSPYQRIVVTVGPQTASLFLNNNLQFSTADERRYHEALVHPPFSARDGAAPPVKRVMIAGGGDGLAVREVLRYPGIERVLLVDLDPAMTTMSKTHPVIVKANEGSLSKARVEVKNADAMQYLTTTDERFDILIVDFPDPNNLALGKLYTTRFYRSAAEHLAEGGVMVVQSTSPFFSRTSFWTIVTTMEAADLHVLPYHAFVPAFGEWGYALASRQPLRVPTHLLVENLTFLDDAKMADLFLFSPDMTRVPAPVNRLDTQALVRLYEREIARVTN
jgi:spermidine synthase